MGWGPLYDRSKWWDRSHYMIGAMGKIGGHYMIGAMGGIGGHYIIGVRGGMGAII